MHAPPLLLNIPTIDDYVALLEAETRAQYKDEIIDLYKKGLPPITSLRGLAVLFSFSPKFIGSMYYRTEKYYRTFTIPKGKKKRVIQAPKVSLKIIQKWFGFHLAKVITFNSCVHGFISGKSAASAAAVHCNAEWVYSLDIEDFFPSIPFDKIEKALIKIGYSAHAANIITKLCTYNGVLPQGSPASPILSNLIFRTEDKFLEKIALENGFNYTRYADDIVFSGKNKCPKKIRTEIKNFLTKKGWNISEKKEHYAQLPHRLKVHGLLVHGNTPRLTKGYRKRIRTFEYLIRKKKVKGKDLARLEGHLSYANSIETI